MNLSILFLLVPTVVVAYQEGQEISISLDSAEFIPLGEEGNQVIVFSNYTVNDPSFVNQKINSVMKVYATNGTLIKTSSSADGFIVNQTGSQRHVTTITNNTLQNVIAVVQYTDLPKTLPLSNPLQVDLNLTQVPALSETESEIAALT
jgi:ribonucleotide monophosphatase NagD (HAD superfamily)